MMGMKMMINADWLQIEIKRAIITLFYKKKINKKAQILQIWDELLADNIRQIEIIQLSGNVLRERGSRGHRANIRSLRWNWRPKNRRNLSYRQSGTKAVLGQIKG